jgi:hypothetical protein
MRYRLRTLLIVLALGPPVLAGAWLVYANCTRIWFAGFEFMQSVARNYPP